MQTQNDIYIFKFKQRREFRTQTHLNCVIALSKHMIPRQMVSENVEWMRREYYARCTLDGEAMRHAQRTHSNTQRTQYRRLIAGIQIV